MSTIMVVDDDAVLLQCLTELLQKLKYRVISFPAAEPALAEITAGASVDIVITDYKMKGMDGIEFLHRLRHLRPRIPVVVLTAHGDSIIAARGNKKRELAGGTVAARGPAGTAGLHSRRDGALSRDRRILAPDHMLGSQDRDKAVQCSRTAIP